MRFSFLVFKLILLVFVYKQLLIFLMLLFVTLISTSSIICLGLRALVYIDIYNVFIIYIFFICYFIYKFCNFVAWFFYKSGAIYYRSVNHFMSLFFEGVKSNKAPISLSKNLLKVYLVVSFSLFHFVRNFMSIYINSIISTINILMKLGAHIRYFNTINVDSFAIGNDGIFDKYFICGLSPNILKKHI